MEYRQLGHSGLRVSTMTLGTMTFGGRGDFAKVGALGVQDARRLVDVALQAGVNLVDTADVYSDGASEEITGEVLRGRRDDVLIATKARFPMGVGVNDAGNSRFHIISAAEASLRRLQTDRIDLFQIHEWDGVTPVEETAEALDTLVRSGKVRYVGVSNFSGWQTMKSLAIADSRGYQRYISTQIHYTLQCRDAESELVPLSLDQGLGIMVWSPLAGGLLTGKYRRGEPMPEGSRHLTDWNEPPVYDEGMLYDIIETLVAIGDQRGIPTAQVGLAWLLGRPGVSTLVVGARTEDQLRASLGAADVALTDDERARLDAVSAVPLSYPYWHQAATAGDRLSTADLALLGPHL